MNEITFMCHKIICDVFPQDAAVSGIGMMETADTRIAEGDVVGVDASVTEVSYCLYLEGSFVNCESTLGDATALPLVLTRKHRVAF